MADYTAKVLKWKSAEIPPGETLLAATKASLKGTVKKMAVGGAIGGVAGAAIANKIAKDDAEIDWGTRIGFAPTPQMVLGLTGQHLLFWRMGGVDAKPKDILGHVPREAIAGAVVADKGMNRSFDLTLTSGAVMELEVPRVHVRYAEAIAAELSAG